jgi:hypothetical protein
LKKKFEQNHGLINIFFRVLDRVLQVEFTFEFSFSFATIFVENQRGTFLRIDGATSKNRTNVGEWAAPTATSVGKKTN